MNTAISKLDSLSPREAYLQLQGDAAIVDIRPEYEINLRIFDVPKVYYLSFSTYHNDYGSIPKDTHLIVSDSVGNQSGEVARFLVEQGYTKVSSLAGGIVDWTRAGLPIIKDVEFEMVGGCACRLHPQKAK